MANTTLRVHKIKSTPARAMPALDMGAVRVWINGKFSVFHTDDTGSIPVTRCLLGEIGIHDRLKICSQLWGIGSSPIVSRSLIPHSTVDVILPFYVLPA